MRRGKVVLKRIENRINRQATFSKRKNGLLKKACELSVLCDAEVAVIIFSSRGKITEFGSTEVTKTIQRYRQFCYTSKQNSNVDDGTQNIYKEISILKAKYESLQLSYRQMLGEELETLSIKELQKIEKRLDKTLSKARQKKTHILLERLEELQRMEHELGEENEQLKIKLQEAKYHQDTQLGLQVEGHDQSVMKLVPGRRPLVQLPWKIELARAPVMEDSCVLSLAPLVCV